MNKGLINSSSLVRRNSSIFFTRVDDDLVLFSANQGMYYGMQLVGSRIWALIEDEVSVAEICDELIERFSVDRETCEREVMQFVEQLEEQGMVVVR